MESNSFERALEKARETAATHEMFPLGGNTPVVAMISGGSDSTALAYILSALSQEGIVGKINAVHVNHCLRGEESDADEEFVKKLCITLGIRLKRFKVDIPSIMKGGGNMEAVAREIRYDAANYTLDTMCAELGIDKSDGRIVTAHTVDDRIESFYMRSIVGTGPGGFRGMKYVNGRIVRPLMELNRQNLCDAVSGAAGVFNVVEDSPGVLWREDRTNADLERFRAYVRHEIVPRIRRWNGSLDTTLTRTMNLIAEEDDMLDEMAVELVGEHCTFEYRKNGEVKNCVIAPEFANVKRPLAKRCVFSVLSMFAEDGARIENRSVEAVLAGFAGGNPVSGYKNNIKGNLAVSANKRGVRIEHMVDYTARTSKKKKKKNKK